MKRRAFAAIMCLMLAMCLPGFAQEASLGYDTEGLERYSSFMMDETSGEWSVSDPLFEAILDSVKAGEAKSAMKDGFIVFQTRVSGNAQSGTIRPEIEMYYLANSPIGVRAVSILAGGVRYDMKAQGVATSIGQYTAERIVLPMEDLAAAQAIAGAERLAVLLHGGNDVYETEISLSEEGKSAKDRLEIASLRCDGLLSELDGLNITSYGLWDLSRAEWEAVLGFEALCVSAPAEAMDMICIGDKGDNVEALQELLSGAGFYAGAQEKEYGAKTAEAVVRAQVFYGLMETGSADAALIGCLQAGSAPAAAEEAETGRDMDRLGDVEICFDRWWQAKRVNASEAKDLVSGLICSDGDNVFAVVEGMIRNCGGAELGLGWQMTAELVVNGNISYACTLRAECDGGTGFASTLLPLAESRLLALAEMPKGALDGAESAVIVFQNGTETIEYSLIG